MTRDDIRKNRGNAADQLGFIGRIMHGGGPRSWLRDLRARIGEPLDCPANVVDHKMAV